MKQIYIFAIILLASLVAGTLLYVFLHRKTRMRLRFLYQDNLAVGIISAIIVYMLYRFEVITSWIILVMILLMMVCGTAFVLTMVRFWRTPRRKSKAEKGQMISPADGSIIYIRKLEKGEIPVSVKGKGYSRLEELAKTSLLDDLGWQIGINMTPFDVHKNCAPVSGMVILNQHFNGKFWSLKDTRSQTENERNTYVIQNDEIKVGVVQIASRMVRRIDSYVKQGESVNQGEWLGMIRFGSQVDVIIPEGYRVMVEPGEQVYAGLTIIAERDEDSD